MIPNYKLQLTDFIISYNNSPLNVFQWKTLAETSPIWSLYSSGSEWRVTTTSRFQHIYYLISSQMYGWIGALILHVFCVLVSGGLLYVVFQELFSSSSPNKVYGKAFNKVKLDPEVRVCCIICYLLYIKFSTNPEVICCLKVNCKKNTFYLLEM